MQATVPPSSINPTVKSEPTSDERLRSKDELKKLSIAQCLALSSALLKESTAETPPPRPVCRSSKSGADQLTIAECLALSSDLLDHAAASPTARKSEVIDISVLEANNPTDDGAVDAPNSCGGGGNSRRNASGGNGNSRRNASAGNDNLRRNASDGNGNLHLTLSDGNGNSRRNSSGGNGNSSRNASDSNGSSRRNASGDNGNLCRNASDSNDNSRRDTAGEDSRGPTNTRGGKKRMLTRKKSAAGKSNKKRKSDASEIVKSEVSTFEVKTLVKNEFDRGKSGRESKHSPRGVVCGPLQSHSGKRRVSCEQAGKSDSNKRLKTEDSDVLPESSSLSSWEVQALPLPETRMADETNNSGSDSEYSPPNVVSQSNGQGTF